MKVVQLVQGTFEWHKWRREGIGGSDAPALLGVSPYKTRRQLYFEKVEGIEEEISPDKEFIFAKGHRVEGLIRKEFADLVGVEIIPICVEHSSESFRRGSLDGYHANQGDFEAKLVGQAVLSSARKGEIPQHHRVQILHNLAITESDKAYWFGHDGKKNGVLVEVGRDEEEIKRITDAEHEFWNLVLKKKAPPLSEQDYLIAKDRKTVSLLKKLREAKQIYEDSKTYFETMKEQVVSQLKHCRVRGEGLVIVKSTRLGNVQWSKIPEVQALASDYLDKFRAESSTQWTVSMEKGKKNGK